MPIWEERCIIDFAHLDKVDQGFWIVEDVIFLEEGDVFEKTVTPVDGFATLVEYKLRTGPPKKLQTVGEVSVSGNMAYDPDAYNRILDALSKQQPEMIEIWEPWFMTSHGWLWRKVKEFYGYCYLSKFEPQGMMVIEQPEATLTITPVNHDQATQADVPDAATDRALESS